jgi:hypothetical protein
MGAEAMAAKSRHLHRLLVFLDPLFGRPALVGKVHHHPARRREVGHGEADPGEQFSHQVQ